jgi:predicted nucleotide-binding protein (sugar kinase/HSP70/actin superfamily)
LRIGYPQALLYYKYFPLWETFFTQLGAEVVVSGHTTKKILNRGSIEAENELCLPVKVFYGHLLELADKVEAIFVPRMVAVEKSAYTCPKFLGLPDMAKAVEAPLPPLIEPIINWKEGTRAYFRMVLELGRQFTDSRTKILQAYLAGVRALHEFHDQTASGLTTIDILDSKKPPQAVAGGLKIGVAGHPYNIYDKYISMNLIKRLRQLGAEVVTGEMLPHNTIERAASTLPKHLFWTYEREVVGTVFHWSRQEAVDGIIYVVAFPCGADSLVQTLIEHELRAENSKVPMMPLVIDEHSAEAGVLTRIEAFTDMLGRKKRLAG